MRRMFVLLGALTSAGPLAIDLYLPALPQIAADLGTSPTAAQLSLTAFMVGLGTGQIVVGPLSDAFGRRRPLLIGLAAFAVVSASLTVVREVEVLIALRVVQGLTAATGVALTKAVVRDLYSGVEAARFFTMLMLVTGFVPLIAPVAGAQLLLVAPWPGLFAAMAAMGAALWLAALLALPETHPARARVAASTRAVLRSMGTVAKHRTFLAFTLTAGFASGAMFCYLSGSSFVLQGVYGLSPQSYSVMFAVNSVGMIIGGQTVGRLAGRVRMGVLLGAGLGLSAAGGLAVLGGVVTGAGLPVIAPALFVLMTGQGAVYPMALTLAMSSQPTHRAGSASALFGLVQWTAGGLAGPLAGAFGTQTALPLALVVAVLGVAACVSGAVFTRGAAGGPAPA
ncbi:multidrug effflux MFS transporter [Actinocorallia sp. A-T 12471]|uniref:multidrug effflux MFS transporter n=1 Tax=Actinocorallia sp. A-T 12471 TaxID=3089813 RepID=UPI0029CF4479|nr:multidrug effflux MFS transporter [Actinocorallia sp. A-T 12471]MDX6741240.1 multidrug effflux MFS transporter [Actinocorallia sp. A-T 12471]